MTKKKVSYPIHKMGKFCGYDEYEDGSIKIAPSHAQKMDNAMVQEAAIQELIQYTMAACQKLMVPIKEAQIQFWKDVAEDYSLDRTKYQYFYEPDSETIRREPKEATHENLPE